MSGVAVILSLCAGDGTVTGIIPADRIVAGTLPLDTALPALGIETISEIDVRVLNRGAWRRVRERVQTRVIGSDYAQAHDLIKAVKRACADKFPAIAGLQNVNVLSVSGGPEGYHPVIGAPQRTHDFLVGYEEPA